MPDRVEGGNLPSLIPDDVWSSYQQEVEEEEQVESARLSIELATAPLEAAVEETIEQVSAESLLDLHTEAADPDEALLALMQVSMFSKVARDSLESLVEGAQKRQLSAGEYLFMEADHAASFHVVMGGAIDIFRHRDEREVALRQMRRGDAVGLFGLFSGQVRAACARAMEDSVVLEIPCTVLNDVVQSDVGLHDRLVKFYQERLLEGFIHTSRIFADVDTAARAKLISRFKQGHLGPGETLVQPGEVVNLIAVVIHGSVLLESGRKAGLDPRTYELYPGQFVAVTGAMSGEPSRMRIFAAEDVTLALLDHSEFASLLRDFPALRILPQRLSGSARTLERDVWCGHTGVPGL